MYTAKMQLLTHRQWVWSMCDIAQLEFASSILFLGMFKRSHSNGKEDEGLTL
jgi:hypothetical protein